MCVERGREGERMLFSFFFLSYLFFRRRRPGERELRSAGGATDQDPSRALHVLLLRSFLYFHGRPFPHSLPPSFFSNMHTRTWTRYVFLFSVYPYRDDSFVFFFFLSLPNLLLLLYYDDDGERYREEGEEGGGAARFRRRAGQTWRRRRQ